MRLFVAINFERDTLLKLTALRDKLRSNSSRGNFVPPENLHLTLVFLGECNQAQVDAAKKAMDKVIFDPFEIRIDSLGRFKRDGSDLWWAGVRENDELLGLQRALSKALTRAGFSLDRKKYRPHITLGRRVVTRFPPRKVEPFGQIVTSIDLVKSEQVNEVLTYTPIYRVRENRKKF